uniref:Uncharacterized protein n=1 Tax=Phlebotomus papatasi TaxID=29031 RepID=A0A1B0DAP7_PHLPP
TQRPTVSRLVRRSTDTSCTLWPEQRSTDGASLLLLKNATEEFNAP